MRKVKNIYLLDDNERFGKDDRFYGATGLVLEMDDGSIITEHTMESLAPYSEQTTIKNLAQLIMTVHKAT